MKVSMLEELQPGEALSCVAAGVLQQNKLLPLWMHLLGSPRCPDPQFCPPSNPLRAHARGREEEAGGRADSERDRLPEPAGG